MTEIELKCKTYIHLYIFLENIVNESSKKIKPWRRD